jgi:hypothetical protein
MLVALVTAVQSSRAGVFSMIRDGARTVEGGGQGNAERVRSVLTDTRSAT